MIPLSRVSLRGFYKNGHLWLNGLFWLTACVCSLLLGPILSLRMVLLVGLPGVGKTMFVTALANTVHVSLFLITPEIIQDELAVFCHYSLVVIIR